MTRRRSEYGGSCFADHRQGPRYRTTFGLDRAATPVRVAQSAPVVSTWSTLIRDGYGVERAVTIEGIPHVIDERRILTTRGVSALCPPDYTESTALVITAGMSISSDADREKGVGGGRALDVTLSRQRLDTELPRVGDLFARPSNTSRLTSTISDPNAGSIPVNSTSGWPTAGELWIGREHIVYSSTTATSFDGCRRGVNGWPHYLTSSDSSGYRYATDQPVYWRGRIVTIWEHLCAPDGRFLGTTLCTVGPYCRQAWIGFVDAQPQPTAAGIVLRCLPIERLLDQQFGVSVKTTAQDPPTSEAVYCGADDRLTMTTSTVAGTVGEGPLNAARLTSILAWGRYAVSDIETKIGTANLYCSHVAYVRTQGGGKLRLNATDPSSATATITAGTRAWFLAPDLRAATGQFLDFEFEVNFNTCPAWLIVYIDSDSLEQGQTLPQTGTGAIQSGDMTELVAWDAVETAGVGITEATVAYAVRLVRRGINGTPWTNPWMDGGTLTAVAGSVGSLGGVLSDMLQSSGTGARGSNDKLGFGFGLGLPAALVSGLSGYPYESTRVEAITDGKASVAKLLGGWFALLRRCLTQRRDADGCVRLQPVETGSVSTTYAADSTIAEADVMLTGHGAPEVLASPSTIEVALNTLGDERKTVIRDGARVAAEGPHSWQISAPGITNAEALRLGADLLRLSDGLAVYAIPLAPWSDTQIGDVVNITSAHPMLFNFGTGTWGPASIVARCVGVETNLYTGAKTATVMTAGGAPESRPLCPAVDVIRATTYTPTLSIDVPAGEGARFVVHDTVNIYVPGAEASYNTTAEVSSISTGAVYDTITFTAAGSSWMGAGCVVSFPTTASATARQREFSYVNATKYWR